MKLIKQGKVAVAMILTSSAVAFGSADKGLDSSFAGQLNGAAVRMMQKGDVKGAILKFQEALALDPAHGEASRNLSKLYIAGGRLDMAEKCLERVLKANPKDEMSLVPLAQVYALRNKPEQCLSAIEGLASAKDQTLLPGLSLLLLRQGSSDMALAAAEKALTLDGRNAELWFNKGSVLEARKEWKSASLSYEKAVSLDEGYFSAWINYGNMLEKLNRLPEMQACYEKAHLLSPDSSLAQYNLGRTLVLRRIDIERGLLLLSDATKGRDSAAQAARRLLKHLIAGVEKNGGVK